MQRLIEPISGGLPAAPELPTDYSRRAGSTLRAATEIYVLNPEQSAAVTMLSESEQTSAAAVFLTVIEILLLRYSDSEVVTIGLGGDSGDLVRLITTECGQNKRVRQLLATADEQLRTSLASLDRVQSWPVLFSFATAAPQDRAATLLGHSDLLFSIGIDESNCYAVSLVYNSDLFSPATVKRMLSHLRAILEAAVADCGALAWRIRILSDSEWHKVVTEWNSTDSTQAEACIHELFQFQAKAAPGSVAVQFRGESLTYEQLNARANQLARYLCREGVGCGTPVGILLDRSPELAVALLAVLKAGGVCVSLDPQYPTERLEYMLLDAGVSVLLTQRHFVGRLEKVARRVTCLAEEHQQISREDMDNLAGRSSPDKIAFIVYTSGSTGKPKGILLTDRGLVNHQRAAVDLYDLKHSDRVLQFSSIAFDIALEEIFPTWLAGATVVFRTPDLPLDARGFLGWIAEENITVLDLPTAYWHELVYQANESNVSVPERLRLVIIGGEKASANAVAKWLSMVGSRVRCINTYGPSEASVIASACEIRAERAGVAPRVVTIGRPITNTRIYVLDHHLNPLPVGVPGELYIGGVGIARGYLNRPDLTASSFIPDPFSSHPGTHLYKTGDRGRWLPNGELEFLGRGDFQVKIRGYRVEPSEIEAVLLSDSTVREAAVVAENTSAGMTRLIAYVVPAKSGSDFTQQWRALLNSAVPDYMIPSAFVTLPALPLTPNGKVDRISLRRTEEPQIARRKSLSATSDPIHKRLIEIWASVLDSVPVSASDNFWELGGNSLLAARLIQKIERCFGTRLTISVLIQAPTVEQLARAITRQQQTSGFSCLVPLQPLGSKAPFFCVHGVGGTVLAFRSLAIHMGPDQPFYGVQAQGLDEREPCLDHVEEMAARYLKEVRAVQHEGPYHLGGFSFGGWVAWEMAQQLTSRGEEVALLALLDSYPFRLQPITSSLMAILRFPTQQQLTHVLPKTVRKGIHRRLVWLRLPQGIKNVQRACYQAERGYTLRPYSGRVTLFRATESLHASEDPYARWHELAGSVEVHDIPGHHGDIIVEPEVVQLAQELRACIDRDHSARQQFIPV